MKKPQQSEARKTAEFLQNFNGWRRGTLNVMMPNSPNPREIGLAIDSAIKLLGRLDALERKLAKRGRKAQ